MRKVANIIDNFRHLYSGYRYFITGSIARNEESPHDIDVNILPPTDLNVLYSVDEIPEWSDILKNFDDVFIDGLRVDAQIIPLLSEIMLGYRGELNRYIYREGEIRKLCSIGIANDKAKSRGVDNIPFAYMEV
jgi:hypothetical protein